MENKSETSIKLVKRLIKEHVRPYFGKMFLAAICMAIVAASTATNAWLMQPVLDEVFLNKNAQLLLLVPIVVMTIAIIKGLASYGESIYMEYSSERIISDVRYRLFSHLMNADLNFFHKKIELNNFWKLMPSKFTPVKRFIFKNSIKENFWFYINVNQMSEFTGLNLIDGVFLDLIESSPDEKFTAINSSIPKIINNHLQYAITWAMLGLIFLVMNYIYNKKNK